MRRMLSGGAPIPAGIASKVPCAQCQPGELCHWCDMIVLAAQTDLVLALDFAARRDAVRAITNAEFERIMGGHSPSPRKS